MTRKPTRLEVTIVVVGLLILASVSRQPRSGSAYMHVDTDEGRQAIRPTSQQPDTHTFAEPRLSESRTVLNSSAVDASRRAEQEYRVKRMARVDATGSSHLGYSDVMYGEITVRWIWNGHKLVPCKVVEVKEADGTMSIWSFDNQDDVVITPLPPEYIPAN